MANDVSIIVSAELGDTLLKLDLAKHAVSELGDESLETAAKQDEAAASTGFFTAAIATMNDALGPSIPLLGGFSAPLALIPALAVVAAASIVALADAIGAVIAVLADLVAPVTLVVGLMGLLGGGFFLAAKNAFGSGGALSGALQGLKTQFDNLVDTLTNRFMPVFQFLAGAAKNALTYLNQIAKLPLDQAFKSLATTGVSAVMKFLEQVGHLLAHPFRLAVQLAFGGGPGGNTISSAVSGLWKQFTDYLFGYTKSHPVRLDGRVIQIDSKHVDGALQPILDWFNRHDFTAQGTKIGHQILNGLKPLAAPLGKFLFTIFVDGFKTAVVGMLQAFNPFSAGVQAKVRQLNAWITQELVSGAQAAWNKVTSLASAAWNKIGSVGRAAIELLIAAVAGPLVAAWASVAGAVQGIIGLINGAVGAVGSLVSALQTAASIASSVAGALGGGSSTSTAGRTGQGGNSPGRPTGPNFAQVNHFHLSSSSHADFRRQVREIGRELGRQNLILAGGQ